MDDVDLKQHLNTLNRRRDNVASFQDILLILVYDFSMKI